MLRCESRPTGVALALLLLGVDCTAARRISADSTVLTLRGGRFDAFSAYARFSERAP